MIMRFIRNMLFAIIISTPAVSAAELYMGIGPLDELADLKRKFPAATYNREHPAWAQEHDVMYTITGEGISGTIIINFFDTRPMWRKRLEEEQDEKRKKFLRGLVEKADDSISVSWVRWIPDVPFPVTRLVTKYGKPEITDFSKEDYQPYKEWKKRGIQAYLTDDGKKVLRIDFAFTKKEEDEAWKQRYGVLVTEDTKGKKKRK